MSRWHLPVTFLAVCLIIASPAAAGLVLSNVAFTPDAPLIPNGSQKVVATYIIVPSGSTTFSRGHSLQMQTNLEGAVWTIQVTLDGRDAARQTASGTAAFVNGELLSYSTDHDVGLVVTVTGIVPSTATTPFSVVTVKELDNNGNAIPGTVLDISQPVTGSVTAPTAVSSSPILTPRVVMTTTATPRSPGFMLPGLFAAFAAAVLIGHVCASRR